MLIGSLTVLLELIKREGKIASRDSLHSTRNVENDPVLGDTTGVEAFFDIRSSIYTTMN